MRVMPPILLVTLVLGVLLVGILAVLQRGTASGDGQDCLASSSMTAATPAAPRAATPPGADALNTVVVNTGLVVVAEPNAVRLNHSIIIQIPSSAPQVAALLGPPWSTEYQTALTSLLQPTDVRVPGPERLVLPGAGPFAEPNDIIARLTAVPEVRIDGDTAIIALPLHEDRITGYPPAQAERREPWSIRTVGRDLTVRFNQDTTGAGDVSPWTRTWQVAICAAGLHVVSMAPVPVTADGTGRVAWTLPDAGPAQEAIEVRLRPEPGTALRLWLFAGVRQYIPQAWSFVTPVLLLLVAYAMVPRALPVASAVMVARRHLLLIVLVSLELALTGLFALGLLAFRPRINSFDNALLLAYVVAAVGLAAWGWWERSRSRCDQGVMATGWFLLDWFSRQVIGPVFSRRRLKRIVFTMVVLVRQVAHILYRYLLLLPGALLVLALIWWMGLNWLGDQTWWLGMISFANMSSFDPRFDLAMFDTNPVRNLYVLARIAVSVAFVSVVVSAVGIAWPGPERGASRWLGVLAFGAIGTVLCTPIWSWMPGLIPLWTVAGFLVACVVLLSTFLLAPTGKSLVARGSSAWAIGLSLVVGTSLAMAAAMWGWARGMIPERSIGGFLIAAVAAAVVLAAVTLRKPHMRRQGERTPAMELVTAAVVGAVLLAITGVLAQWARSTFNRVSLRTRLDLDADPERSIPAWYEVTLRGEFLNFPLNFIGPATDLLLLVGTAGVVGVLRAAAADQRAFSLLRWPRERWWIPSLVILLYAALVVGYAGEALGYRLPVAFLLALILLRLGLRVPTEGIDREAIATIVTRAPALTSADDTRGATPAKQTLSNKDGTAEVNSTCVPGGPELPWNVGPRGTWWDNGVWAFQRGACLAILPVGYFVYVLLRHQLDFLLAPDNPFGAMALITGLVHEVAFWLTAAFAFGALAPCLWSTFGPLKGAGLTTVYAGSHAVAAILLGEASNNLWEVRSFQLLLFLAVLGVWFDYSTLGGQGNSWGALKNRYHIDGVRAWVGYLSPLVVTIVVVIRQLYTGETSDAVNQIITDLAGQVFSFPFP